MNTVKHARLFGVIAALAFGAAGCAGAPQQASKMAQHAGCRNAPPAYPAQAQRLGVEGVVKAAVLIGADGSYRKGEVRKSSGSRLLDEATLAAAAGWCWKPTMENGVPVEAWQEFDYTWSLK